MQAHIILALQILLQKLSALANTVETLTIDYTEGHNFDPRAGLSECCLADSFLHSRACVRLLSCNRLS
jgi:hypothetical protein